MNWIPIEIETKCLDAELIAKIICEYIDVSDFAENMLNEIYGNCKIGNFLIPTGTALRRIYETEDSNEWEDTVKDILNMKTKEIKFGLENDGSYYLLSYHFILVDNEENGE